MKNLPARVLFEKSEETYKRLMLRTAMVKIATLAITR